MFKLLYICASILLLFPYQLLLTKIEVIFPKFALEHVYFFVFILNKIQLGGQNPN
jgi:hypothetical protein